MMVYGVLESYPNRQFLSQSRYRNQTFYNDDHLSHLHDNHNLIQNSFINCPFGYFNLKNWAFNAENRPSY